MIPNYSKIKSKRLPTKINTTVIKTFVNHDFNRFTHNSKREVTRTIYFETAPNMLSCFNHVKFLDLGMSCLEEQNKYLTTQKNLYLVESNFQTFYMRIEDKVTNYEISLMKTLKEDNLVLKLIKHKVVNGRFAGIYHYVGNQQTLYNGIMDQEMTIYDKLGYMEKILKIVSTILDGRNTQNSSLKINILPSNLLMVDEEPYALKLIEVKPTTFIAQQVLITPEDQQNSHVVDQKATHVYFLGKVFYFLFFKKYPVLEDNQFFQNFLQTIQQEQINGDQHLVEIFLLIRRMLNNSMVDRPGLMEVFENIKSMRSSHTYWLLGFQYDFFWTYQNMKNEINYELIRHNVGEDKIAEFDTDDHSKLNSKMKHLLKKMDQRKHNVINRIDKNRKLIRKSSSILNNLVLFNVNKMLEKKIKKLKIYNLFMDQTLQNDVHPNDKFGMLNDFELSDLFFKEMGKTHTHGPLSATFQFEYDLKDLMEIAQEVIKSNFINDNSIYIDVHDLTVYQPETEDDPIIPNNQITKYERLNDVFLYLLKNDMENILEVDKIRQHSLELKEDHHEPTGFFEAMTQHWPFIVIFIVSLSLCFFFMGILVLKRVNLKVYHEKDFNTYVDLF